VLILSNDDIEFLLSFDLALPILESAYKAQAAGRAINRPRTDMLTLRRMSVLRSFGRRKSK
jgi:hypothetical protein